MPRASIRIETLGGFSVRVAGRELRLGRKVPRRPLALLKYLGVQVDRLVCDAEVALALWPDRSEVAARRALAVTVHRLRRLLGAPQAIVREGGRIGVDRASVWCDAADFERTLAAALRCPGRRERLALTARALELYRGDFLPGEARAGWAAPIRARLHESYLLACRGALGTPTHAPRIRNRSVIRAPVTSAAMADVGEAES